MQCSALVKKIIFLLPNPTLDHDLKQQTKSKFEQELLWSGDSLNGKKKKWKEEEEKKTLKNKIGYVLLIKFYI